MTDVTVSARDTIETHVREGLPFLPLEFEGVTHDPIDSAGALRSHWARLTILYGDSEESTMGEEDVGENEVVGVVIIDVFGEPGLGKGPLLEQASKARKLFRRRTIGGVEFGATSGPGRPTTEREGWLHVAVRTPFTLHEVI